MAPLSNAELMLYSTVKITCFNKGKEIASGTGFYYQAEVDAVRKVPLLITNKHVLEGADSVEILGHEGKPPPDVRSTGRTLRLRLGIGGPNPLDHPDPDIDLTALALGEVMSQCEHAGQPLLFVHSGAASIPQGDDWDYFDAIENVTMVGCPSGIYDTANNLPLFRQGITASPLSKRFEGKNEFMVDMACFPGSSGSPIYLYDQGGYFDRRASVFIAGGWRLHLVGILYSGPQITNEGVILARSPKVEVGSMMHLGYAIRATEIFAIEKIVKDAFAAADAAAQ